MAWIVRIKFHELSDRWGAQSVVTPPKSLVEEILIRADFSDTEAFVSVCTNYKRHGVIVLLADELAGVTGQESTVNQRVERQ
jgi:hypothetical protein